MSALRTGSIAALLVVVSLGLALFLGEIALRIISVERYYVFPPGMVRILKPRSDLMPGISGDAHFAINESGMRGDPYPKDKRFKILAIGGSTTICSFLDQAEAWPQLLQEKLNTAGDEIWVGNVGRSGHNTRHHMLHVEKLLEQHADVDLIIILVGANDMSMRLKRDVNFRTLENEERVYREKLMYQSFSVFPLDGSGRPFYYKNTEIYRLLRKLRRHFIYKSDNTQVEDTFGTAYQQRRENRANASRILTSLPDMSLALDEYRRNLNRLIDMAQERGSRIVFLTQPYMWRQDLPESLSRLLWLGGVGDFQKTSGQPYYSVEALAKAMQNYNQTLLNVCRDRGISCLDLAQLVPQDTTSFSDDIHFNEQGARTVADAVARFLRENQLLD